MADKENITPETQPDQAVSEEQKTELLRQILKEDQALAEDRQEWLDRQTVFLENWDNFVSPTRTGPWQQASNVHVPFTMQQCLNHHARMLDVLFGTFPCFYVMPTEQADAHKRAFIEKLMIWAIYKLANRYEGIVSEIDRWLWDWATIGRGVLKCHWEEERETFMDLEDEVVQVPNEVGMPVDQKTGNQVEVEKERVVYSGPRIRTVDPLNFKITPGYSVADAPTVIELLFMTKDELDAHAAAKIFSEAAVAAVKETAPTAERAGVMEREIAQRRDDLSGNTTVDSEAREKVYHVLEWYGRFDINGDGTQERVVVWVEPRSKTILGWNYINRLSKSGRPPFYMVDFIPRREGPMGLVELMWPINQELDSMHNLRIDSMVLLNVPWGTVKESKAVKADEIMIGPGQFVPVMNHDDLQIRSSQTTMPAFHQEEAVLLKHGERLGIDTMGFGQVPANIGPLGTASGTMALLGEMNKRLAVHITRVRTAFGHLLRGIYHLLKENIPLETSFRVTGEDGRDVFGKIESRESFASDVDFDFVAPTNTLNRELKRQSDLIWLQTISNPLYIQIGVSTPETLSNALKDVARSLGKEGVADYVARPQSAPQPQSLEEEIAFLLQGIAPIIVLNDDHAAKIQGLMAHRDSDELRRFFDDDVSFGAMVSRFNWSIQKHQEMLQAIQAQAAASNVSGLNIAPTMGNRLAGGTTTQESPAGAGAPLGGGAAAGSPGISGGEQ